MKNSNRPPMLIKLNSLLLLISVLLCGCDTIRDSFYERYGPPYIRSGRRADILVEKLKKTHENVFYFCDTYRNGKNVWYQNGDTVYMYNVFPWITKREKIITQRRISVDSLKKIPRVYVLDGADFYYISSASQLEEGSVNLKTIKTDTSQIIVALRKYLADLKIISR